MLRVAKATSPMSIGTWLLMGFSGLAFAAAAGQAGADRWPKQRWMRSAATAAGVAAAGVGAGLWADPGGRVGGATPPGAAALARG